MGKEGAVKGTALSLVSASLGAHETEKKAFFLSLLAFLWQYTAQERSRWARAVQTVQGPSSFTM